jgi:hypothetical protein
MGVGVSVGSGVGVSVGIGVGVSVGIGVGVKNGGGVAVGNGVGVSVGNGVGVSVGNGVGVSVGNGLPVGNEVGVGVGVDPGVGLGPGGRPKRPGGCCDVGELDGLADEPGTAVAPEALWRGGPPRAIGGSPEAERMRPSVFVVGVGLTAVLDHGKAPSTRRIATISTRAAAPNLATLLGVTGLELLRSTGSLSGIGGRSKLSKDGDLG